MIGNQNRGDQLLPPAMQMGEQTIPQEVEDDPLNSHEPTHVDTIVHLRNQILTSKKINNSEKQLQVSGAPVSAVTSIFRLELTVISEIYLSTPQSL